MDLPESTADIVMEDAPAKKDRATEHTKYISHQRKMYIYYTFENGHRHDEACTLANVSTYIARKWRVEYKTNPEAGVLEKKTRVAELMKDEYNFSMKSVYSPFKEQTLGFYIFGFFKILNCFCGVLCFMFAFVVSNVRNTNILATIPEAKVTAVVREEEAKERLC